MPLRAFHAAQGIRAGNRLSVDQRLRFPEVGEQCRTVRIGRLFHGFSEQKMVYNPENGTVIYRSRMHAKTKRNFEVFSAEEFIAAIAQHIPDKGFQMVRYYGWYSNRARGERAKHEAEPGAPEATDVDVIDVSEYPPAHPFEEVARADQEGLGS